MKTSANQAVNMVQRQAVTEVLASVLVGSPCPVAKCPYVTEAEEGYTKQEIEQIVRRVLARELEEPVLKLVKKELKAQSFDDMVVGITSRALAKFFELMFTRRSTWVSQIKGK